MNNFKLPPHAFSDAINNLCPKYDFTNWETSVEWKLFNAGKAEAFSEICNETAALFKKTRQKSLK